MKLGFTIAQLMFLLLEIIAYKNDNFTLGFICNIIIIIFMVVVWSI